MVGGEGHRTAANRYRAGRHNSPIIVTTGNAAEGELPVQLRTPGGEAGWVVCPNCPQPRRTRPKSARRLAASGTIKPEKKLPSCAFNGKPQHIAGVSPNRLVKCVKRRLASTSQKSINDFNGNAPHNRLG
jgi:hypothetical protein